MAPASLPSTARKIDRGAVLAQPLGLVAPAPRRRCRVRREIWRCRARARCRSTMPMTPLPAGASKPRSGCQINAALGCGLDDRGGERMLAAALDAGGKAQAPWTSSKPGRATIATTFGLPSVSVPVLSTTSVSTFSMRSSASAFLISTPSCAPRPTPTMIDIGVARPSAQGQAMISTLTAATSPIGKARLRPEHCPGGKGGERDRDHRRHEPGGDLIGQPLDRRAATLRVRHHLHDLRQQVCRGRPCPRA